MSFNHLRAIDDDLKVIIIDSIERIAGMSSPATQLQSPSCRSTQRAEALFKQQADFRSEIRATGKKNARRNDRGFP
jgi:hypothetical protein